MEYQTWRILDTRYVWKLNVDFAPKSNFSPDSLHSFSVPMGLAGTITTNISGAEFQITFPNPNMLLSVALLNAGAEQRLVLVGANDEKGKPLQIAAIDGLKNLRTSRTNLLCLLYPLGLRAPSTLPNLSTANVTVAVVPNAHATYFVQPRVLQTVTNSTAAQ
jgi:hypothetical protein